MGGPRLTCGRCPKWRMGVCLLQGRIMVALHPVCEIGRRFIRLEVLKRSVRRWRENNIRKEVRCGKS